jgi:UMF1 family MFS transporter
LFEDGARAQTVWGLSVGLAGIVIAILAPILGAIADNSGNRLRWVWFFSVLYVVGAAGLWYSAPDNFHIVRVMVLFGIGLIGMEFATIFTNSMLPDLGPREEIGRISGSGWAWGYVGGLIALVLMLTLFAENANGVTLLGRAPALGLDPAAREGTRFVGPLSALWYIVFMVPFFLWVRDPKHNRPDPKLISHALGALWRTIRGLPEHKSLFAFLASSMFYRDALNGLYTFGGLYAAGVLGWSVVDSGVFGIIAIIAGALFAWLGGKADVRFGPKPVIVFCTAALTVLAAAILTVDPGHVLGLTVPTGSRLPDIAFYVIGALLGAAGGAIQSASRTMMVRQGNPERMTEAFGLYALAGKATSFIAPITIGIVTAWTGSQKLGVSPLIGLFAIGLILLIWVRPDGEKA